MENRTTRHTNRQGVGSAVIPAGSAGALILHPDSTLLQVLDDHASEPAPISDSQRIEALERRIARLEAMLLTPGTLRKMEASADG
jgi:hypothetical protein